jgi:hypothetical protein
MYLRNVGIYTQVHTAYNLEDRHGQVIIHVRNWIVISYYDSQITTSGEEPSNHRSRNTSTAFLNFYCTCMFREVIKAAFFFVPEVSSQVNSICTLNFPIRFTVSYL